MKINFPRYTPNYTYDGYSRFGEEADDADEIEDDADEE